VLQTNGYLIIAEVISRLPKPGVFVRLVKSLGFKFVKYMKKNEYFVLLIFKKKNSVAVRPTDKIRFDLTKEESKSLKKFVEGLIMKNCQI